MTAPGLTEIQRWFLATITRPGLEPVPDDLVRHIADGPGLGPAERLQIYASGYFLRLRECLRAEFPVLRGLLGEELFDRFAQEYLAARPSRSYTLFELGAGFAEHLERTRPPLDDLSSPECATMSLPVELARLERAWVVVLRSRGEEGTDFRALEHFPIGPLGELILRPAANLQIVATSFPLAEFYTARRVGLEPKLPEPAPGHVAVSRWGYCIHVTALESWQRALILALVNGPTTSAAIDRAAMNTNLDRTELAARSIYWLPQAIARGLLSRA